MLHHDKRCPWIKTQFSLILLSNPKTPNTQPLADVYLSPSNCGLNESSSDVSSKSVPLSRATLLLFIHIIPGPSYHTIGQQCTYLQLTELHLCTFHTKANHIPWSRYSRWHWLVSNMVIIPILLCLDPSFSNHNTDVAFDPKLSWSSSKMLVHLMMMLRLIRLPLSHVTSHTSFAPSLRWWTPFGSADKWLWIVTQRSKNITFLFLILCKQWSKSVCVGVPYPTSNADWVHEFNTLISLPPGAV